MAKKYCGKNLDRDLVCIANKIVVTGYNNGLWHSMIFHTIVLLILALIVEQTHKPKSIRIKLSFSDNIQAVEDMVEISEMEIDATESVDNNNQDFETLPIAEEEVVVRVEQPEIDSKEHIETYSNIEYKPSDLLNTISGKNNRSDFDIETKSDTRSRLESGASTEDISSTDVGNLIGNIFGSSSIGNNNPGNQNTTTSDNNGFGDIGNRLKQAGAKTGDIQISIGWDTIDDVDLHVLYKNKFGQSSYICWMSRAGVNNGMLDIDMNANPSTLTNRPVENIFWPLGQSPDGEFIVGIHNFRNWSGNPSANVTIIVKTQTFTKTIKAAAFAGRPTKEVFKFSNPQ
jgi:hypothetical protein